VLYHDVIGSLLVGMCEAVNVNGEVPGLAAQACQTGLHPVLRSLVRACGAGPGWTAWPHGALTPPCQEVPPAVTVTLMHAQY
jgi:hypothetical protein